MPAVQAKLKADLKVSKHSLADVCRETGIDYRRLAGYMNGYWYLNISEEQKVHNIIDQWLKENEAAK